jgi:hypothetical protein
MATEFAVIQEQVSGNWQVLEAKQVILTVPRLEEAVAQARARLLERETGSMVVYTPSGRPRERFRLTRHAGAKSVQLA